MCCRNGGMHLAVLHPRKVVVYSAASVDGSFLQLTKLFEHGLEHTAANMAYGPFGGVSGASPARSMEFFERSPKSSPEDNVRL